MSPSWDEVARLYREAASRRSPSAVRALHAEVLRLAGRVRGRRALDVGFTSVVMVRRLAERGALVVGTLSSSEALEEARSDLALLELEHEPELVLMEIGDGSELPSGPFDLLTSLAPTEGVPLAAKLLRNMTARLRRGARLVLAVPHPYREAGSADRLLQQLFGWLRAAGLRVIDLAEVGADRGEAPEFVALLAERPGRRQRKRRGPKPAAEGGRQLRGPLID
jgi:SAM-dependent methyltransferase